MEKKTSLAATFFICFLGFSAFVNSQSDSCTSKLTLTGIPFATTSLTCQSVWTSQDFILRYQQSGSVWNLILSTPNTNAYVAIGFSPDGRMVGSSSIVGWVPSGGKGVIKQYYLGGLDSQSCQPDKGSLKVSNMTIVSQSSRLYLAFQLNTNQPPQSNLIYAVGPKSSLPSSPDYLMAQHQSKTSTTLNFATGQSTSKGNGSDSEDNDDSESSEGSERSDGSSKSSTSLSSSSGLRNTYEVVQILGLGILMFINGFLFTSP
ncbi:PREDICTED: cytochrome b561 and DOMON domain-containing protein At3g07570-like [Nelumbo nucifera]|uniref:Cytochrome b561 and DOMON domain-containing protein At3g07570-like n=1 Tax=Nelumbo nucifera TaxID=4432 RepID=A0A1U8ALM3_NELNU|nr:PREDICTED: cytochrome b561 and DOMON domain-containing protein At3g07570-like [Nelumbo nucifera]